MGQENDAGVSGDRAMNNTIIAVGIVGLWAILLYFAIRLSLLSSDVSRLQAKISSDYIKSYARKCVESHEQMYEHKPIMHEVTVKVPYPVMAKDVQALVDKVHKREGD